MEQQYSAEKLNYGLKIHDFMRWNALSFSFLGLLFITSLIIIVVHGFNFGIDFTGGTVIEISLEKPVDLSILRSFMEKSGFIEPQIQNYGSSRDVIVRLSLKAGNTGQKLGHRIISIINQVFCQEATLKRIEFVGPSVSSDLAQSGVIALLTALFSILAYVSFRFEWRLALSAVLALIHDLIITIGILSLFYIEIDSTIIASLMSIIGYSLNDSIVVSDRIRENFYKIRFCTPYEVVNISLTQTLSRTIVTSATTLIVLLILFIFGGTLLKGFSLTMIIGITIGTISSIYVVSPLALKLGMKRDICYPKVRKGGKAY